MFVALLIVHIIAAITLVLIVLLQAGRGAELGAAFGGMGQSTYGRGQSTFISKFTTGLAILFMSTSLSLAFLSTEEQSASVLSGLSSRQSTPSESGQGRDNSAASKAKPGKSAEENAAREDAPPPLKQGTAIPAPAEN